MHHQNLGSNTLVRQAEESNKEQTLRYLRIAANGDDLYAQESLAIELSGAEQVEWFEKASANESAMAANRLGEIYDGRSFDKNIELNY